MNQARIKKLLIISFMFILIVTILISMFLILVFRVTKTTPSMSEFPTAAPYIDIYLSKDIAKIERFSVNDEENPGTVDISKNRLRFSYNGIYKENKAYVFELKGIRSKSGDSIDYKYEFTPEYIAYENLPEEIKKAGVEKSSSKQIDDPFFNNYFPMQTEDFQIENTYVEHSPQKSLIITFLSEVYDYDANSQSRVTNEKAEALRTKALNYIKSRGGTPEKYIINYANPYLQSKYAPPRLDG